MHKTFTPGSVNGLFSDLFREFWRGVFGGVQDYFKRFGEFASGKVKENQRKTTGKL